MKSRVYDWLSESLRWGDMKCIQNVSDGISWNAVTWKFEEEVER
jgi:hypothetical protein